MKASSPSSSRSKWLDGTFGQYLRASSIHGVKYIGQKDLHHLDKLFWIISVLAGLGISIFLCTAVIKKYFDNPVIISLQPKETPVALVPFPAITICNVNIMKRQLMDETFIAIQEDVRQFEEGRTDWTQRLSHLTVLVEHINHFCLSAPTFRRIINETLKDFGGELDTLSKFQEHLSKYLDNVPHQTKVEFNNRLQERLLALTGAVTHRCEDLILECMWNSHRINCTELFRPILTQHGSCCVFNMMPRYILKRLNETTATQEMENLSPQERSAWENFKWGDLIHAEDDDHDHHDHDHLTLEAEDIIDDHLVEYPIHQREGGLGHGLSVLINPEVETYSTCKSNDGWGFKVVAHSPISFPSLSDYGVAVPPRSEVFVDIEPHVTIAKEQTMKSIDVNKRGCYFPDDKEAKEALNVYTFYTSINCFDECIARETDKNCSCVRHFMPRNHTQKLCGALKMECAEEVRGGKEACLMLTVVNITRQGKAGNCGHCRPSCTEIRYKMELSHFPLRNENNAATYSYFAYSKKRHVNDYSIVHIYLGLDKLNVKERKRLYDLWDLVANAGGFLGLTLGFSIISVVEILYFCTIRVFFHFLQKTKAAKNNGKEANPDLKQSSSSSSSKNLNPHFASKMDDYYVWALKTSAMDKQRYPAATVPPFHLLRKMEAGIAAVDVNTEVNKRRPFYSYLS